LSQKQNILNIWCSDG